MISARIILDSMNEVTNDRLTTMEVILPRIVLAEFNTHRVFSRNSASSRAIPVAKIIERIKTNPFLPVHWGRNQPGMQAETELVGEEREKAIQAWLRGRDRALETAQELMDIGVHKQIANRVLEPWMYTTIIVSSTRWRNFFKLRYHAAADPNIKAAATAMLQAIKSSIPKALQPGEWHIPMIDEESVDGELVTDDKLKVSTGRTARVSYLTHNGIRDVSEDINLHDRLSGPGHWSPFEHAAKAAWDSQLPEHLESNFKGWIQYRKCFPGEAGEDVDFNDLPPV